MFKVDYVNGRFVATKNEHTNIEWNTVEYMFEHQAYKRIDSLKSDIQSGLVRLVECKQCGMLRIMSGGELSSLRNTEVLFCRECENKFRKLEQKSRAEEQRKLRQKQKDSEPIYTIKETGERVSLLELQGRMEKTNMIREYHNVGSLNFDDWLADALKSKRITKKRRIIR